MPAGSAAPATKVRLIGIDAPEAGSHFAEQAAAYLVVRTTQKPLILRLEPTETRDRFGRLLAYVYSSDASCVNQEIVRDGFAYADRRHRHSLRAQFEMAENEARKKSRGLWKDLAQSDMPEWRREWLRERSATKGK